MASAPEPKPIDWDNCPSLATHWDTLRQWWVEIGNKADDPVMIFDEGAKLAGWQTRCWLKTGDVISQPDRFVLNPDSKPLFLRPDGRVDFVLDDLDAAMAARTGQSDGIEKTAIPAEVGGEAVTLHSGRDALQIIDAATQHMRDRAATYDQPQGERSMGRTVTAFNAITGRDLKESEGWLLLQLLKDVRQWQNPDVYHRDSAEDAIAYAGLKAESLESGN